MFQKNILISNDPIEIIYSCLDCDWAPCFPKYLISFNMLIKPRINPKQLVLKAIRKSVPKYSKAESIGRHYWARQGRKAHQQATSATFRWVIFSSETLNASWKYILLRHPAKTQRRRQRSHEREAEGRRYFRPVDHPRTDRALSAVDHCSSSSTIPPCTGWRATVVVEYIYTYSLRFSKTSRFGHRHDL